MLRVRIIPVLLLKNDSLVKTIRFNTYKYIGHPCNTVRIFNELEVDELMFLDIHATKERRGPNLKILSEIASECFMPLAYGGGIRTLDQAKSIFDIGIEKVVINASAVEDPRFITALASHYGSQSIIVSIDVKKGLFGSRTVRTLSATRVTRLDPVLWAQEVESRGAGEILLTSIDREGTWEGFDLELVRQVSDSVSIPVIAHGGAGSLQDIGLAVHQGGASAVALGSMVVFQKKGMGVLINFPNSNDLNRLFEMHK